MSHNATIKEDIVRGARFITMCLAAMLAMALVPTWASAAPATLVDDFAGGTYNGTQNVAGSVQLTPTVTIDDAFGAGPGLPTGWTAIPWPSGGSATVGGGALNVDGALARTDASYDAGQSLAFRATFTADAFQHVGFATDYDTDQNWAAFSTGGVALPVGLYARTNLGGTQINERLDVAPFNIDPLVAHNYEIQWEANVVRFYVDSTLVSTQVVTLAAGRNVAASDYNAGGGVLTVDQLRLAPYPTAYPASGTFTSRVLEADRRITAWHALTPEGTALGDVTFETRSGNTPTPDATWSAFQPLGAGGAIQSPVGRYIQYRTTLAGGATTPVLDRVTIGYEYDNVAPSVAISGVAVSGTTATVSFSSSDADVAGLECSLDGGAFVACTSPKVYTGLAVGNHTVSVRATDKVGNIGAAATRTFTIQRPVTPPPAGDHSGPKVVPTPRSVRASRTGRVTFRVRCPKSEQRCRITLQLKRGHSVVSSKKTVRLLGGKRAKLTLRLTKKYRRYLSIHSRLKAKAVTVAYDAVNNRKTTRVKVTVRAPKHKR